MDRGASQVPSWWRRLRGAALGVLGFAALYAIALGIVMPYCVRTLGAKEAGERLGRAVAIDQASFNPFTLAGEAKGLRVLEADGRAVFLSLDTLDIDVSASSFWQLAPVVDRISFRGLKARLVRDAPNHYNVSDLLARLSAAPQSEASRRMGFSLANIRLTDGRVDFDDQAAHARHAVSAIELAIPFLSSLPVHAKDLVRPSFSATIDGTPVRLTAETLPFDASLHTVLQARFDGLDLTRYAAYAPLPLPVRLDSGRVAGRLWVRFDERSPNPAVELGGHAVLSGLAVSDVSGKPFARIGAFEVDLDAVEPFRGVARLGAVRVREAAGAGNAVGVEQTEASDVQVDWRRRTIHVTKVVSRGGRIALERGHDGSLALPRRVAFERQESEAAATPWSLALDSLELAQYEATVRDASVTPAITHRVALPHFEASGLVTRRGLSGRAAGRAVLEKGGTLDASGSFTLSPLEVKVELDARDVNLVPFRAYAAQFPAVALQRARAGARGSLTVAASANRLRLGYRGDAEVTGLATYDTLDREPLLNWKSAHASAVALDWRDDAPLSLAVREVIVRDAYSRVVVNGDGRLNFQQLRTATEEAPQGRVEAGEPRPRDVRIDRIAFVDGRLDFTDHYIKPNYSADVGSLNGQVTGLSSDPESRATVMLEGRYDESSPVVIAGTANPLRGDLFLDLAAKGSDIALPKLTAYSQRYAGYGISAGRLTLDVKYHLENGVLEGRNRILVDQLTFGEKVESPDAIKVPVLFAVSLLKDAQGRIDLELPVSGSLEDPQFEIGGMIAQVAGKLLRNAVAHPFSLLAAAFGKPGAAADAGASAGGEATNDDLAYVDFAPGRSEIAEDARRKLETLARALQARPALHLEVSSRLDADRDLDALKRAALRSAMVEAKRAELGGKAGEIAIGDEEYAKRVRGLYRREKLPPGDLSVAAMEARLLEKVEVGEAALHELAMHRAEQVVAYLAGQGHVGRERLVALADSGDASGGAGRVVFALR